jgi:hypothetical protein
VEGNRFLIERDRTRLKVVHRQRVLRQGDSEPAPGLDPAEVDPAVLERALAGWQRLVETEYESVVIAGWMTAGLARLGAPLDVIGAFGRVVEDEIRHVDICAQMVECLGGHPSVARAETPPFPVGVPPGAAAEEVEAELLGGLVGFFCVFEHLSAHVFRESLEAAETAQARWALSEIHRDEAFHGAFGFETAKVFVPSWSEPRRRRLGERVAADVLRFEQRLGGPLPPGAKKAPAKETRALERIGLLGAEALLSIFYAAVKKELLPRLEELQIPVQLAIREP